MRPTGHPDADGDLAFDVDVALEAATEAMAAREISEARVTSGVARML